MPCFEAYIAPHKEERTRWLSKGGVQKRVATESAAVAAGVCGNLTPVAKSRMLSTVPSFHLASLAGEVAPDKCCQLCGLGQKRRMRRAHSLDVIGPLSEELLGGDWKRVVTFGDDVRARDGPPRRLGQRLAHRGVRLVAELGDRAPGGQGIDVVEEHGLRRHGFDVVANSWAATEPRPGHQ